DMVAEKLKALVGASTIARAGQSGNMRERLLDQRRIPEAIADPLLEFGCAATALCVFSCRASARIRGCCRTGDIAADGQNGCFFGLCFRPAAHRTIVNSRPQRTDQGQRQTIQACSPSIIEKKMI